MRLGRDLATTVSATLGGVGGIRTADRMSIASEFQSMDVTSPAAAAELGRRLGAGSVLRGALVAGDHRLGASRQPRSSDRLDRLGLAAPDIASRAVRARDGGLVFLAVDPRYEPLHQDARFQCLLRRIGFPDSLTVRPREGCRGEDA